MSENRWPEITSKLTPKAGGPRGKDSGAVTAEHDSFIHSFIHSTIWGVITCTPCQALIQALGTHRKLQQKQTKIPASLKLLLANLVKTFNNHK